MNNFVTINGKNYKMPTITFREIARLEDLGYSLFQMVQKRTVMINTIALACVSCVLNIDKDDAVDVVEEHLNNGGGLLPLATSLLTALEESEYFTQAFAQEADVQKKAKKKTPPAEATQN